MAWRAGRQPDVLAAHSLRFNVVSWHGHAKYASTTMGHRLRLTLEKQEFTCA